MRNLKIITSTIAASLLLASCNSRAPVAPQVTVAPAPRPEAVKVVKPKVVGINGKWAPTDPKTRNVYYNEFRNGKFVARSPDSKTTLAAGTYKNQSKR